jgi:hypothetical protein
MNGLDEFAEAAVAIFVGICGLMVLVTRLQCTLLRARLEATVYIGSATQGVSATAKRIEEPSQ